MVWIRLRHSNYRPSTKVAPIVRTGGSRHTGLAAPPQRNMHLMIGYEESEQYQNEMEEGILSGQQDASIVADHMMLEAAELGLGSVWVDGFPNTKTAEVFHLPKSVKLVCLMPVGYAADDAKPAPMHEKYRPIDEMVKIL